MRRLGGFFRAVGMREVEGKDDERVYVIDL